MSHAHACIHTHSRCLTCMHSSRRFFFCFPCPQHTHVHSVEHGAWQLRTSPEMAIFHFFLFFFFHCVTSGGEREENVSRRRKTSKNTVGVGATAEVKQSESCRQSFNLKRTRSPWGARGAGRIKKFNNSMFYGPRK